MLAPIGIPLEPGAHDGSARSIGTLSNSAPSSAIWSVSQRYSRSSGNSIPLGLFEAIGFLAADGKLIVLPVKFSRRSCTSLWQRRHHIGKLEFPKKS